MDPVEVYEVRPGYRRDKLIKNAAIAMLPPDAVPDVGDIILLSRKDTGGNEEDAYWNGHAPFEVVQRERLYMHDPEGAEAQGFRVARNGKIWIFVRRIPKDEYLYIRGRE
jgi:hypothetical protein